MFGLLVRSRGPGTDEENGEDLETKRGPSQRGTHATGNEEDSSGVLQTLHCEAGCLAWRLQVPVERCVNPKLLSATIFAVSILLIFAYILCA